MANLQEFNPGDLGLRPSETGVESFQSAGRRIGASYNQVAGDFTQLGSEASGAIKDAGASYLQYAEHKDISKLSADFAIKQDQLIKQWNDTAKSADPNDPTVAQKFREQVLEPQLEDFGSDAATEAGQNFAQSHVAALRNHMFEKTAADMSTLAGVAAKVNFEKTVNALSNTAMNDPSSLDHSLQIAESSIKGMAGSAPNLSAADAARVTDEGLQHAKEQIVKSAAFGVIQKTGQVPSWATDPKYSPYINGMELKQFEAAAKAQQKSNQLVDKQTQLVQRQLSEQNVHQSFAKAMVDNITFDPQTGQPIVDPKFFPAMLAIARDNPNAPNAASVAHTGISWGESQQNKGSKPADDPATKTDLMDRMFSADKPTTLVDLAKAHAEGKISDHTFQSYHGLVQELEQAPLKGPIWQDTIGAVKGELILSNVGLPGKDIAGEGNYAKWAQTFIPQYQAQSRAGTLPPNALDVKDPNSMISQSMAPFKRTIAQRTQDYLSVVSGGEGSPSNRPGPAIAPPTRVTSPAEAAKLSPGTRYQTPDGKVFVR
jgi:hypothetical protein